MSAPKVQRYGPSHPDRCQETAVLQQHDITLDKATNTVRNVKVVGLTSVKNRKYTLKALREALPHYEGCRVNIDHAKGNDVDPLGPASVRVRNRFGRLINANVKKDGVYADLRYNPKHSYAAEFEGWVETDPSAIALSHDAILQGPVEPDGTRVIDSIPRVFSVDIVADPGSTKSLFEDDKPDPGDDANSLDVSDPFEGGSDSADHHLANAIFVIVQDKDLSKAEKLTKIKALLDVMCEGEEEGSEEKEEMPEKTPEKAKESVVDERDAKIAALELELDKFRASESLAKDTADAKELCSKSLPPQLVTDLFVKNMVARGRENWEECITDRKSLAGALSSPVSSSIAAGKAPSVDDFVNDVKSGSYQ